MATKRNAYPDAIVDLEAGVIDDHGLKAAGYVSQSFYSDQEYARIEADLADFALDIDTSLTRARRDRDRAIPRDVTDINSRKRRTLPSAGVFRRGLSSRQHQQRSATKRRVLEASPQTGRRALAGLVHTDDPTAWQEINAALRESVGNANQLTDNDRRTVQRVDRLIQGYERESDRGHVVYVVAKMPEDFQPTTAAGVPTSLQPGSRLSFDQFSTAHHTLEEAVSTADQTGQATIILEIETGRGIFLGDSTSNTSHLLPRGLSLRVEAIDEHALHPDPRTGQSRESLVVQCSDGARQLSTET